MLRVGTEDGSDEPSRCWSKILYFEGGDGFRSAQRRLPICRQSVTGAGLDGSCKGSFPLSNFVACVA